MHYVTGEFVDDPTMMLATLSVPAVALCSLLLVGFANVGTQAVGSYTPHKHQPRSESGRGVVNVELFNGFYS